MENDDPCNSPLAESGDVGFDSTRSVAAVFGADMKDALKGREHGDDGSCSVSPLLTALVTSLESNPAVFRDLALRTEAELDQDEDIQASVELVRALIEIGLQTVAPQYAVVLRDIHQSIETES